MELPPSDGGTSQLTIAPSLPATEETFVGASGTVIGTTSSEEEEGSLKPVSYTHLTLPTKA